MNSDTNNVKPSGNNNLAYFMLTLKTKNMRSKQIVLFLFLVLAAGTFAQPAAKFGYVDSDYILSQIPEFKAAQTELDKTSAQWQKEVELKFAEVDKLNKAYQADAILLTDEMKKKREQEITTREKEAKEFQRQKFGVEGDLFKKRQELVKPIQDKVYNAIKSVADKNGLGFVLDKSGQLTILYANSKYDRSDDVLEALGYIK